MKGHVDTNLTPRLEKMDNKKECLSEEAQEMIKKRIEILVAAGDVLDKTKPVFMESKKLKKVVLDIYDKDISFLESLQMFVKP